MKTLYFLIFLCGVSSTSAMEKPVKKLSAKAAADPLSFGVGLNLGIMPGIDAGLQVNRFIGVRVKGGYFRYNNYPYDVYVESVRLETKTSLQLGAVELLGDVTPFGSGLLRVTGGLAVFTNNTIKVKGYLGEPIYYQGVEIKPEEVGYMDADIHWSRVGAYLGIGMGKSVPARRVGVGFDLGVYYLGKPQVSVNYTDKPSPELQQALQEYVTPYKFMPYVNIRVACRLVP